MKKELSVFIDESGDFGALSSHAPYYIIALIFHEQADPITQNVHALDKHVANLGFEKHAIHTGPLIRRESVYENHTLEERKRLFGALFNFTRKVPIQYKTVKIQKADCNGPLALTERLSRAVAEIIRSDLEYFQSFDSVIIYYDNGQIELTKILIAVFHALLSHVEFRKVAPGDYKLFQAADLICTLELLAIKAAKGGFSKSEKSFFQSPRDFKKNFYKPILRKQR